MMRFSHRTKGLTVNIFAECSILANRHQAIDLGAGIPDFEPSDEMKEAATRAVRDGNNQYAFVTGLPALRSAVAQHATRFYNQDVDPEQMVLVTSGATEATLAAVLALVDPGDEVVLFEPCYELFPRQIRLAGGEPIFVSLRSPDAAHARWWFDPGELEAAFGPRTKAVLLNTPHNPTGKVFTEDELALIAASCERVGAFAICDEVYEHLAFAPAVHRRLGTMPGMQDRTITVSSCAKTFTATGWKVGWIIASARLRQVLLHIKQLATTTVSAPLQAAVAVGLGLPDRFFEDVQQSLRGRRDQLAAALEESGLRPLATEGGYFSLAEIDPDRFENDVAFCRWLITEAGVAALPLSAFYAPDRMPARTVAVRFAFCKSALLLDNASRRLRAVRDQLARTH